MKSRLIWLIRKASRDTTSGSFIAEIDGLRFIAVFAVILFHLSGSVTAITNRIDDYDPLATFLSYGHYGVQLFFVISGFVIALPFAKGHLTGSKLPQLRQFYFRRLTRLEPPYFINLIFCYLLAVLYSGHDAEYLLSHLLASMGYVHNIIYKSGSAINYVAWSLEVEIQFYIFAPLITSVFMIRSKLCRRALLVTLIAIFSTVRFFMSGAPDPDPIYSLSVLSAAQYFLTGFLLVDVYLLDWNQVPNKSIHWDVISVIAWGFLCVLLFLGRIGELFIVVPIFIAYCAAFKGTWSNRIFNQPFIYIIGGMCYTIYLYHPKIISVLGRLIPKAGFFNGAPLWLDILVSSLAIIPILLMSCTIIFIYTEKPFMKKDWYLKLFSLFGSSLKNTYSRLITRQLDE